MKVIILDVDGVLNGFSKFTNVWMSVAETLHLREFIRKHYDIFGVRSHKVRILKYIIMRTGAVVVLSSSWRYGWYHAWFPDDKRQGALHKLFERYGIQVIGITGDGPDRNDEIHDWLNAHKGQVENFLVLDDELFKFDDEILSHMVHTAEEPVYQDGYDVPFYRSCGLKWKHARKAIKILNGR